MRKGEVVAEAKTRRVRFIARPPARLEAGGIVLEAGAEGVLPAELAEELAANPHTDVVILADPATEPEKEEAE